MILVTGATGRVGAHLMEHLADAEAEATAMVRVEARALGLYGSPPFLVASLDQPPPPDTLRQFDRIFLLSPEHEQQATLETALVDAIVAAGHQPYVLKVAADGFQEPGCEVRFMRSHRQVAAHLEATGLPVSYLGPAMYLENLLADAGTIRDQAVLPNPSGRGRAGFVAASDVAAAAARLLTRPQPTPGIHVLTGPALLSYPDIAARISKLFARQVEAEEEPAGRTRDRLLARGLTSWQADGYLEWFSWIRQGGAETVTTVVRELTGTDPRPLDDWLNEARATFLEPPSAQAP